MVFIAFKNKRAKSNVREGVGSVPERGDDVWERGGNTLEAEERGFDVLEVEVQGIGVWEGGRCRDRSEDGGVLFHRIVVLIGMLVLKKAVQERERH